MQLRIAVIGAGSMGMNHLRVLREFNEEKIQLVGIAETYEPNLKRAVSRFHVAGHTDYRQMVEEIQPDLVAVVVPTSLHFSNHAIGVLDINWLTPTKVRELSITGEKSVYIVNYLTQEVYFYENDYTNTIWDTLRSRTGVSEGTIARLKVQKAEPLLLEYEDVIGALLNDTLPPVTGEDGVAVLQGVLQLTELRYREGVQKQEAKVALETEVEVEA